MCGAEYSPEESDARPGVKLARTVRNGPARAAVCARWCAVRTREAAWTAAAYGATAVRVARRGNRAGQRLPELRSEERLVFVVGSPRSGTTFLGRSLGAQPGFVDLGEVPLLKAAVPRLVGLPEDEQTRQVRAILQRVRRLALVRRLRGVEQGPETSFVLRAALGAFPAAVAVHARRDARLRRVSALLGGARAAGGVPAGERGAPRRLGLAAVRRRGPRRARADGGGAVRGPGARAGRAG